MSNIDWTDAKDYAEVSRNGPNSSAEANLSRAFLSLLKMNDPVNHPSHYTLSKIECIDAIKAALGDEGFSSYCKGNAIKYLWRAGHKNNVEEDLSKAVWYINRLINHLTNA